MSPLITCLTLIDITNTGVTKGQSDARDQHRNWESVIQMLSLKTQPIIIRNPKCFKDEDLENMDFGEFYQGPHHVWAFQFRGERDDFYSIEQLEEDFDLVPIILGLDETARFMLPIFHTGGTLKNIYFISNNDINIT
jgi:hypothetical protein